ncbi:MAG: hypothetical protein BGO47_12075 [Microbacterium sp. 67-17]|nr:MAG: hypothetical protein BGO47_12075 [Microbacterium sp. 67-17]
MEAGQSHDAIVVEHASIPGHGPVAVVHGGVDMEPIAMTYATLETAGARALDAFAVGEDGISAAVSGLAVIEDDPAFNAGLGSVLTRAGTVETDGAVSNGSTHRSVGVGAVPGLRNPARLAHLLLQERNVALLVGDAAASYARAHGILPEDLVTQEQQAALIELGDSQQSVFTGRRVPTETIGCLTLDAAGSVSSASSTGGLVGKLPGRVGDSCIVGAGFWTDDRFGVLCSGSGEASITRQLARRSADLSRRLGAAAGVRAALIDLIETAGATAAIVLMDAQERVVVTAHNGSSFPVVIQAPGWTQRLGAIDAEVAA